MKASLCFTQYVTLIMPGYPGQGASSYANKNNCLQVLLCYSHFKWYMRCHVISQKVIYLYAFWEPVVIDFFFPSFLCCSLLKFRYSKKATKSFSLIIWHYYLVNNDIEEWKMRQIFVTFPEYLNLNTTPFTVDLWYSTAWSVQVRMVHWVQLLDS